MNLIQSIIYGIVSGISSFLPVSSYGHQVILRKLFGMTARDPLLDLFVHIGLLLAVAINCRSHLAVFSREFGSNKRRRRHVDRRQSYEIRLLVTGSITMLLLLLFNDFGRKTEANPLMLCLFFIINGIILYITDHLRQSNKDASQMAGLDGILMGLFAGLSIFPGISRLGASMSLAVGRGADKPNALNWALLLGIPALGLLAILDLIAVFTASGITLSFLLIVGYLLAAVCAFVCGYATIMLMRFFVVNTGFSGFACYSWGMAILTFILYLIA